MIATLITGSWNRSVLHLRGFMFIITRSTSIWRELQRIGRFICGRGIDGYQSDIIEPTRQYGLLDYNNMHLRHGRSGHYNK